MTIESFNLNIRYDYPVWEYRVPVIYSKTKGWIEGTNFWFNRDFNKKYISASVEPSGLLFGANMDYDELQEWKTNIKNIATKILGYKVGELELGEVGDTEWLDPEMKVLEEFRSFYQYPNQKKNPQDAWRFYDLNKSKLTELDELEQMKIMFRMNWHELHDSLASDFQHRRHPSTAKFLFEMVNGSKIPEFDYKPVSRKCVWALADIGTEESKSYLSLLNRSEDTIVADYAKRRLERWDIEKPRKGRFILSKFRDGIKLEKYEKIESKLPDKGQNIIGYQTEDEIVVYQAYKPSIAKYSVEKQQLGGTGFSYDRMSWIKPGFLWMMYRSGWARKENQEHILAISIKKNDFEEILSKGILSSFDSQIYSSHDDWKEKLKNSEVRLQWDPDHDPYGNKKERKAIQIGLKGNVLYQFGNQMIKKITDITQFVQKQRLYVEHGQLDKLEIPDESTYLPNLKNYKIGITGPNIG